MVTCYVCNSIRQAYKKVDEKSYMKKSNKLQKIILIIITVIVVIVTNKIISDKKENTLLKANRTVRTNSNETEVNETSSFPTEVYGVPVYTQLIEKDTNARPGTKRKIKYIVIHETDNFTKGTGAKNHAQYLSNNNTESTSWHYTVDDKEIYHHIPDNEIAHHAATEEGNSYGIGIELCVNKDGNFDKTFDNATKLVAYLLKEYNLTIDDIKTHHDFSGKDCPNFILKNDRMDEFIEKVEKILKNT